MKPALNLFDSTSQTAKENNCIDMNNTLSMILQPTSFDADQLKSLALNIIRGNSHGCPGVIMVANAVAPKDNGLVAVNLAVTIAENSDRNVILIDCNFHSPSVHSRFKLKNNAGLVEYFANETPLYSILLKTKIDRLKVLPCGNIQNQSSDILFSDKLPKFISELKEKCPNHVLVINADQSKFSGRYRLSQDLADGIILSVDESVVGKETTKALLKKLQTKKLVGVIKKRQPSKPVTTQSPAVNPHFEKTLRLVVTPNQTCPDIPGDKQLTVKNHKLSAGLKNKQEISPIKADKPAKEKTDISIKHHKKLIASINPESFEAEQFKMVTARLMDEYANSGSQVFMTTSFSPGEGKSFAASNIAASLAHNTQKKVLLIDCDLRSPSIHTFFGIKNVSGLSEYLSQDISLSSQCSKSGIQNLSLLTAGNAGNNSFKLLSSKKMAALIKNIKKKFKDVIIILDSAPPNLIAESGVLSKLADGIAIVTSHRKTKREEMKKLIELFDKEKIIGVVYNRFKQNNSLLNFYKHYCKHWISG